MSEVIAKFDRLADGYREHDYGDAAAYFERKARLVVEVPPRLARGDSVLDYGCGDGALGGALIRHGIRYTGVDASEGMVAAARTRQPEGTFEVGTLDGHEPAEMFDAVVAMRSFNYAQDRQAFFAKARRIARKKFVFDFDPRVHDEAALVAQLRAAGFQRVDMRPFLMPQRHRLPSLVQRVLFLVEPLPGARLLHRTRFPALLLVSASS